jgi:hypothetical protein
MLHTQQATRWTFDTLAEADKPTLEKILLENPAPDFDQCEGYIYCGWNHEWVGKLSGEKFKKGFRRLDGKPFGYNEIVRQDGQKHGGEWNVRMRNGRPIQVGFFRVSYVKDEPPQKLYEPYLHTGHFNYNVPRNKWLNYPFRVIRDFVVLPNPDDHSLMLCKAYFQLGFKWLNLFYCYFLLGHRQEIEYEPW